VVRTPTTTIKIEHRKYPGSLGHGLSKGFLGKKVLLPELSSIENFQTKKKVSYHKQL